MQCLLFSLPDLQSETERRREVIGFRKIKLPTDYTLLVFTTLEEYDDPTDTRVSLFLNSFLDKITAQFGTERGNRVRNAVSDFLDSQFAGN